MCSKRRDITAAFLGTLLALAPVGARAANDARRTLPPQRALVNPTSPDEANDDAPEIDPETAATASLGRRVSRIEITGNERTRTGFLLRLLTFAEGKALEPGDARRSVQNLKNAKLFKSIKLEYTPQGDGEVAVRIDLVELWTTIPVLLFSTGGGSVLVLAGIVEANLFGNGAVSYLTYQYLDGTNSWTGQIKYPDFLDSGFEATPHFWLEEKNNEVRTYDARKDLLGGWTSHQNTFGLNVRKPVDLGLDWMPFIYPGLGARWSKWTFSESALSHEAQEANERNGYTPPRTSQRGYGSAEIQFGRVDFDRYLANGTSVIYRYTQGEPLDKNSGKYSEHFVTARYFRSFPPRGLVAVRYEWAQRHSNTAGDEDMLGGLFHVRGLPNDIFRGLTLWQANVEFRYLLGRQRYFDWQGVVFSDSGDTGNTFTQKQARYRPSGAAHSVGGGIRVLFPDISELALRVDYGWLLAPFRASGLSLGVVQFVR